MDPLVLSLWHALSDAFALGFRAAPGKDVRLTPTTMLMLSGEPLVGFNVALIFGGAQPDAQLRAFCDAARERSLPLLVMVAEEVAAELAATVQDLGLAQAGSMPLMVYRPRAASIAPTLYQIVQVETEQDLRTANTLAAAANSHPVATWTGVFGPMILEAPGTEVFLARRDGVPVSMVVTVRGGRSVGVFNMATPPEHQRKGAGSALLSAVIAWHVERGRICSTSGRRRPATRSTSGPASRRWPGRPSGSRHSPHCARSRRSERRVD